MGNSRPVISGSTPNRWGRLRRAPSPILGRSKKSNAMRISDLTPSVVMLGAFVGLMPAFALDGTPSDGVPSVNGAPPVGVDRLPSGSGTTPAAAPARGVEMPRPPGAVPAAPGAGRAPLVSPVEAFRSGTQALRAGEKDKAVTSLQYAAEQGHALAQWKLGRMYAEGDGVERSDLRAFEYFSRMAAGYADDSPGTAQARFVANAFVALGNYYLDGIPNSSIKADPARAHEMFNY